MNSAMGHETYWKSRIVVETHFSKKKKNHKCWSKSSVSKWALKVYICETFSWIIELNRPIYKHEKTVPSKMLMLGLKHPG